MSFRLADPFDAGLSAGQRFVERRTVPRYFLRWQAAIFDPINRTVVETRTNQVSVKGCYVSAAAPLDQNAIVRLRLQWRQETVEIWSRVTGVLSDGAMGLAFLGTGYEDILARWISAGDRTSETFCEER